MNHLQHWGHFVVGRGFAAMAAFSLIACCLVADTNVRPGPGETPMALVDGTLVHPQRLMTRLRNPGGPEAEEWLEGFLEENDLSIRWRSSIVPGLLILELPRGNPPSADDVLVPTTMGEGSPELGENVTGWRTVLEDSGRFAHVECDPIMGIARVPDDQDFHTGRLWGLNNLDLPGVDVRPREAWDITTGSPEVVVGVLDSGILYSHDELVGQMWENPGEIPDDQIDNDENGYVDDIHGINAILLSGNPLDDHGHGTHVSGIVAAAANGGGPMVGVAWDVRLMGLKVLDSSGFGSTSDLIIAHEYAIMHGCRVVNASLGGGARSQSWFEVIAEGQRRGVLLVAAAGNEGSNNDVLPSYPANYDLESVVSVAAMDRYGQLTPWSNYGNSSVDVAAPGASILSLGIGSNSSYQTSDGTSQAAPFVAGVAALIASEFPDSTAEDMRQRIISSAAASDAFFGRIASRGWVDAHAALDIEGDGLLEMVVDPPSGSLLLTGTEVDIVIRVSDIFGIGNAVVEGVLPVDQRVVFANDGVDPDVLEGDALYTLRVTMPSEEGTYTFSVEASAEDKEPVSAVVTYRLVVPPPNDNFADAIKLPGTGTLGSPFLETSTLYTTVECHDGEGFPCECEPEPDPDPEPEPEPDPGEEPEPEPEPEPVICRRVEPFHADLYDSNHSLWWTWTAPEDGEVFVSTQGSDFDTVIGIYTGNSIDDLVSVAAIDDVDTELDAYLDFTAIRGVSYRIAVAGSEQGEMGTLRFRLLPGGAEDSIAPRITVTAPRDGTITEENRVVFRGTSRDPEPNATGVEAVLLRLNDESIPRQAVGIDSWVASVPLLPGENSITVNAVDYSGNVSLTETVHVSYLVRDPENDHFYRAAPLAGLEGRVGFDNTLATREGEEPLHGGILGGHSLWYAFTPETDGILEIRTGNASFDTVLALYTGDRVGSLELVTFNDDREEGVRTSRILRAVRTGVTHYIALDGFSGTSGTGVFSWNFVPGTVHALTTTSSSGGLVSPGSGLVTEGRKLLVRAVPESHQRFVRWEGDMEGAVNPLPLVMESDLSLHAVFEPDLTDTFEDLSRLGYSSDGAPWEVTGDGVARSGTPGDGESSSLVLEIEVLGGTGRFDYRVSSEPGWDFFEFLVDGERQLRESGEISWRDHEFALAPGVRRLEWRYAKDFANAGGEDAAFIDNLRLPLEPRTGPDLYLELRGEAGGLYRIEFSVNLADWEYFLVEDADERGVIRFPVSGIEARPERFFRAVPW